MCKKEYLVKMILKTSGEYNIDWNDATIVNALDFYLSWRSKKLFFNVRKIEVKELEKGKERADL